MRSLVASLVLAAVALVSLPAAAEEEAPALAPARKVNVDFVVGGLVSAGSAYAFSAYLGTGRCANQSDACRNRGDLLIPFAGPMMYAARIAGMPLGGGADGMIGDRGMRFFMIGFLAADSLVQIGGVALAAYGILRGVPEKRPTGPTVNLALGLSQVGLHGTF